MNVVFGLQCDSLIAAPLEPRFGLCTVGPHSFLAVLETQLGLPVLDWAIQHIDYTLGTEGVEKFVSTPELKSQAGIGDEPLECGQIWTLGPGGRTSTRACSGLRLRKDPAAASEC